MGFKKTQTGVQTAVTTPQDAIDVFSEATVATAPSIVVEPLEMGEEDTQTPIRTKVQLVAILVALYTSLFLGALDATVVATAVPSIASEFHSASGYSWVGGAYILATAALTPIWAKLSDVFGRKPIILTAIALFFVSSIMCALSTDMKMLIAGRAIQGVPAGGIFQMVTIVISDLFSMRQRTLFFGFMEIIWAVASGVGPVLGGALSQKFSWRWIWWLNLPLSGIAFILLVFFLNVKHEKTGLREGLKALDWAGMLSIVGLTLMLLIGLQFGGAVYPWSSPKVICLIIFGSLMCLVFIWCEKKLAKYPLMPLELFSTPSTLACMIVGFFFSIVFIAAQFFIPLYLQAVLGAGPLRSGVLLIPLVLLASASGMITGLFIHRTGKYVPLIWAGTILISLASGLYMLFNSSSSIALVVGLECLGGIAAGLLFQPPLIGLQAHVKQKDIAAATATYGFVREIASAIGIVVGGVVFQNGMSAHSADIKAAGASAEIIDQFSGANAAANTLAVKSISNEAVRRAVKEAFAISLRDIWILVTAASAISIVATYWIKHRTLSEEHIETETGLKKEEVSS